MSSPNTSQTLLTRLRDRRDQEAWHLFSQRYEELILRFGIRRGLQPCDAEDVRQLVLLKLSRRLPDFEYQPGQGRFRAYLGRVVLSAIHDILQRPRVQVERLRTSRGEVLVAPDDPALEEAWEREWRLHHYRRALKSLRESVDAKSVEVFEELLEGKSVATVAECFAMSPEAVYKVKQRLRDRLRSLVATQLDEEERTEPPTHGET